MTRPLPTCEAASCDRLIPRHQRICSACFKRLPYDYRAAIARASESRSALSLSEARRSALAWLAEHTPAAAAARILGEAPP